MHIRHGQRGYGFRYSRKIWLFQVKLFSRYSTSSLRVERRRARLITLSEIAIAFHLKQTHKNQWWPQTIIILFCMSCQCFWSAYICPTFCYPENVKKKLPWKSFYDCDSACNLLFVTALSHLKIDVYDILILIASREHAFMHINSSSSYLYLLFIFIVILSVYFT